MARFGRACIVLLALISIPGSWLGAEVPTRRSDAPSLAGQLDVARQLIKDNNSVAADSLCQVLLVQAERRSGRESLECAEVIEVLVDALIHSGLGGTPEALELARRGLRIREKKLGGNDLAVASSLLRLGQVLNENRDLGTATQPLLRSLGIREAKLGPQHPDVAEVLTALSIQQQESGEYAAALASAQRSVVILESAYGRDHVDIASSLQTIGRVHVMTGQFQDAFAAYERAIAIRERAAGPDDYELAWFRNNFASAYFEAGEFTRALPLYERALASLERTLGRDNPEIGMTQTMLANDLAELGEYDRARLLYENALSLTERLLGSEHTAVADAAFNLAVLLDDMGDPRAAHPLARRSLVIREKTLGPDHLDVSYSLEELARIAQATGQTNEALGMRRRTLAIREAALGPEHPWVATSLDRMARCYLEVGDVDSAGMAAERSLAIRRKTFGDGHRSVAESQRVLAWVQQARGNMSGAQQAYERALAIQERTFGAYDVNVPLTLHELAATVRHSDPSMALVYALRADSLSRAHLTVNMQGLPERQALLFAANNSQARELALSLVASDSVHAHAARVWDALIQWRGVVLEEMASRRRSMSPSDDSSLAATWDSLTIAQQVLAFVSVRGAHGDPSRFRIRVDSLARQVERLQTEVARRSTRFRAHLGRRAVGFEDVALALPAGSALVAYAAYSAPKPKWVVAPMQGERGYLALVLLAGERNPQVVPLGPASRIDSLVEAWSTEVARPPLNSGTGSATRYRARGEALRRAIWDPLLPHLGKASRLFVVPDGAMNLVNIGTFPTEKDKYWAETGAPVHYLPTERDLVASGVTQPDAHGLLALAHPDYDAVIVDSPDPQAAAHQAPEPLRGRRSSCAEFRHTPWLPLPETLAEAGEVEALWNHTVMKKAKSNRMPAANDQAIVLTGSRASETQFKARAEGNRIVHLATHGFFLDGQCSEGDSTRGVGGLQDAANQKPGTPSRLEQSYENPLLLSGLVLAGANHQGEEATGTDDGILTADEITALNLSGTECAVLSACETGLGRIASGEGVFGLRRAFQIGGAESVVMSLWSVDDKSTRLWMQAFYDERLARHATISDAANAASRATLMERRRRRESTHPFFWGAFIASGGRN